MRPGEFYAVPRVRCYAPSASFPLLSRAVLWCGLRAREFRVGYSIWTLEGGRPRLVKTVPAGAAGAGEQGG